MNPGCRLFGRGRATTTAWRWWAQDRLHRVIRASMLVVIYQLALTAQCVSKAPVRLRGKDSMTAQCANWCDAENAGSQCGWCKCQACPNCKAERAQPGQPQSASMQLEQSQLQVFEPVADQPCFGQTPCLHTSASERVASGCMDSIWEGSWQNAQIAARSGNLQGKMVPLTPSGLSNRFKPAVATECDITDLSLLSPSGEVEKSLTDAKERHLLVRLRGLQNKLWLTLGTSVDHRSTRLCPLIFGIRKDIVFDGHVFDFCIFERFNFTMMYAFQDGFSTTVSSRNASQQRVRFSQIQSCLNANGFPRGPDFLTMAGVEWDFKHWQDANAQPDFAAIHPAIKMQIHTAQKQWPTLSGLFLRTQYRSDKYASNPAHVEHYNHILRSFHKASTMSSSPCKSIFVADMALLMRHNGTRASGWTDGLHPAPWISLQYVGLCANLLADLGELCSQL